VAIRNFPSFPLRINAFSPEDSQVDTWQGSRRQPQTQKSSVEVVVDAAGGGDFMTIADALTFLGSNPGVVHVKAGTYTITATLTLTTNQELRGSGYGTLIQTTSNITMVTASGNRSGVFNLRLDGNSTGSSQKGIVSSGNQSIVRDCWITNMGGNSVVSSGDNFLLTGCYIQDAEEDMVVLSGDWVRVSDCFMDDSSEDGVVMSGVLGGAITGCQIVNNGEHGINSVSSAQCLINGNYIFSNGDNNTDGNGIALGASHDNCVIGNVCHTNDGYGIAIANTPTNKVVVIGNSCLNNEDGAILDNGTATLKQTATDGDPLNIIA